MRLFVAVNLPPEIRGQIHEKFLKRIPPRGFNAVKKENLHFTLCFIGEKNEEETGEIRKKLSGIRFSEFEVEVQGIGSFDNRVLWIGVKKGREELEKLAKIVMGQCEPMDKRFDPHLTLARAKEANATEFKALLDKLARTGFRETFTAKSVELMKSKLTANGPIYEVVSERTFSSNESGA